MTNIIEQIYAENRSWKIAQKASKIKLASDLHALLNHRHNLFAASEFIIPKQIELQSVYTNKCSRTHIQAM